MMDATYQERMKWFHEVRFGIFVHWGLYSILGRGEWVMRNECIPADEYALLADQLNPSHFDADEWAALAKEAGAKYMVLTTRHHDGFCLFDSQVSDFTSAHTAARRDFVREFADACRRAGLKVGLYYSWIDWRFDGFWDKLKYPESAEAMVQQAHDQLRELMTNYGKIDILWYDGQCLTHVYTAEQRRDFFRSVEANEMVRKLQPHIIINDRCGLDADFDTPEKHVTASMPGRAWESCMTMGYGWGYIHNDPSIKSTAQIIYQLVTAASGEGNYLLNCGPKANGRIRTREINRLKDIGKWVGINGESIYGSQRSILPDGSVFGNKMLGMMTARGRNHYMHVCRWPRQGEITIAGLDIGLIESVSILGTNIRPRVESGSNGRVFLRDLPRTPPDPWDTVVKVVLK